MSNRLRTLSDIEAVPDLAGQVLTVAGPVDPADLGTTLMHEHLFADLRRPAGQRRAGEDDPAAAEPLTLTNLSAVRRGSPNADNDVIDDADLVVGELQAFTRAGGGTIVDVTGPHIGRDPEKLRRLAERTGLNVVMGCGHYTPTFHPEHLARASVAEVAAEVAADVIHGADGTGIRAGIIGEIGAESAPLGEAEWKVVRASARAGAFTGAPLSFHHGGQGEEKLAVIETCLAEGVPAANIVMGHSGGLATDLRLARRVLATGVFIEFDFLASPGSPWGYAVLMSDHTVARGLAALVQEGYADQIVLGHDVCQKIQLTRYGGHGYGYITDHFLPTLRRLGVSDDALTQIMQANPARALSFAAPGRDSTEHLTPGP